MPELNKKRRYDDACAAAHAMDLIGERWALLVARELMLGPKRFADLKRSLPGISAPVLSQRLRDLQEIGVAVREELPPPASVQVYRLTDWGLELEQVMQALGSWAVKSPARDPDAPMGTTSLILSLRTMFSPQAAKGRRVRLQLDLSGEPFRLTVDNGELEIERGEHDDPHAALRGDAQAVHDLVYNDAALADLEAAGRVEVIGAKAVVKELPTLFPLPQPDNA